jgi:polyphosphate kinase
MAARAKETATLLPSSAPQPAASAPPPGQRYFNRELSWLAFNRRVLEEACNPQHPLLERLRFLSISANNLDEFFMVRVAGLKAHQALGVEEPSADGMTNAQQLAAIAVEADRLVDSQEDAWRVLKTALGEAGVIVVGDEKLNARAETWLDEHFREQIFPTLTPQAIDPPPPLPIIPHQGVWRGVDRRRGENHLPERRFRAVARPRKNTPRGFVVLPAPQL